MRNPFRLWLRLLGLTGEPQSFALPDRTNVVLARLLRAAPDGLHVRPWRDGVRVEIPSLVPLLPDQPTARVRVLPDGGRARAEVTYGLRFLATLYACALPYLVVLCGRAVYELVRDPGPGAAWSALVMSLVLANAVRLVVENRRGLRLLRERMPAIAGGDPS